MEDKSVESVYYCMEDHSMKFINQTVESLGRYKNKCPTFDKTLFIQLMLPTRTPRLQGEEQPLQTGINCNFRNTLTTVSVSSDGNTHDLFLSMFLIPI